MNTNRKMVSFVLAICLVLSSLTFAFAGNHESVEISNYNWLEMNCPDTINVSTTKGYYHISQAGFYIFGGDFTNIILNIYDNQGNPCQGCSLYPNKEFFDFNVQADSYFTIESIGTGTAITVHYFEASLPAPSDLSWVDEEAYTYSYSPVFGASAYVHYYYVNDTRVGIQRVDAGSYNARGGIFSVPLDHFDESADPLRVEVLALMEGQAGYRDLNSISRSAIFANYTRPAISLDKVEYSSISWNISKPVVSWDSVDGAKSYYVCVYALNQQIDGKCWEQYGSTTVNGNSIDLSSWMDGLEVDMAITIRTISDDMNVTASSLATDISVWKSNTFDLGSVIDPTGYKIMSVVYKGNIHSGIGRTIGQFMENLEFRVNGQKVTDGLMFPFEGGAFIKNTDGRYTWNSSSATPGVHFVKYEYNNDTYATIVFAYAPNITSSTGICGDNASYVFDADTRTLTIRGVGPMFTYASMGEMPWNAYRKEIYHVVVEEGVTSVCNQAFQNFTNLESVSLPDSLTSIGWNAFINCESLSSITIPKNVKNIYGSGQTFANCASLTEFVVASDNQYWKTLDGVLYSFDEKTLFSYPSAKVEDTYVIPEGVEHIMGMTFTSNDYLERIDIPSTVVSFDGPYVINNCSSLSDVWYNGTKAAWDQIATSLGTGEYSFPYEVSIHSKVQSQAWGELNSKICWLYENNKLSIVGIGDMPDFEKEQDVPWQAYKSSIVSLELSEGITSLGRNTASYCNNLINVTLPSSLRKIVGSGFKYCSSLAAIELPAGLESLGSGSVFIGCDSLASFSFKGGENNRYKINSYGAIVCGSELCWWPAKGERMVAVPDGITSIGWNGWTFNNNSQIEALYIPKSVTKLYGFGFSKLENITDIYYEGTEAEWTAVSKAALTNGSNHLIDFTDAFKNATMHYNASADDLVGNQVTISLNADNKKYVKQGDTVTVTLDTNHNINFNSLALQIAYDSSVFELTDVTQNYSGGFTSQSDSYSKNPYVLSWTSNKDLVYDKSVNEHLATLTFKVKDNALLTEASISVDYFKGINKDYVDGVNVNFGSDGPLEIVYKECTLQAVSFYPGDTNGDNIVDFNDAIDLLNYIVGNTVSVNNAALDINKNGKIDAVDVILLLRYIIEGTEIN